MTATLSSAWNAGVSVAKRCNTQGHFLLAAYVVIFAAVFLSNNPFAAQKLFEKLFLPAAFFLIGVVAIQPKSPHFRLSLSMTTTITFSLIFIATLTYLLAINISTTVQPDLNKKLADQQWLYAGEILLFVLVTSHSVARIDGFLVRLIAVTAPIVAVSASINIWTFLASIPAESIIDVRLKNWLGMPGYTNSTNISLTYAVFFVAAFAVMLRPASKTLLRWWLAPCAAALLVGVLLTQSRSAYFGSAIGVGVVILLSRDAAFWKRNAITAVMSLVLAISLLFTIPLVRTVLTERGESLRPEIWKTYIHKARQKPLVGYGGLSKIDIALGDGTIIDQPHNLVLSAQIRGGLAAMLAMLIVLGGSLYWSARYWVQSRNAIPLAMIVAITTTGMFDYNLLITSPTWPWVTFWLPFGICAGAEVAVRSADVLNREIGAEKVVSG